MASLISIARLNAVHDCQAWRLLTRNLSEVMATAWPKTLCSHTISGLAPSNHQCDQ